MLQNIFSAVFTTFYMPNPLIISLYNPKPTAIFFFLNATRMKYLRFYR